MTTRSRTSSGSAAPSTSFSLSSANPARLRVDAVVVGVLQAAKAAKGAKGASAKPTLASGAGAVTEAYGRALAPLLDSLSVTGKAGEVVKAPTSGTITAPLLVLVGLGAEETPDAVRRAVGAAARALGKAASVALALPADSPALVRAVVEGWTLGGYTFTAYQRDSKPTATGPVTVQVLTPQARAKAAAAAVEEAQVVSRAVAAVRDWVNTPPGDLTPPVFADAVVAAGRDWAKASGQGRVKITVHDEKSLAQLGCGGILGVGAGSTAPPRLVELSYAPRGATRHLALVGKGITFDSGGLSIKPAQAMVDMKCDMAGAAAVVQATFAIAALGLPVKVSAFAPMAENMVSGTSTRPGDILTMYGGTTVEVSNTDAEGRLVLGDALVRAVERKPDVIIDVATLTGAMIVALGDKVAGVMGSPEVVDGVLTASRAAGEPHWAMPIPEEMKERVTSSKVADLAQHDWVRWGGGLFAAAFLREFTAGLPWAHLDIAGPAYLNGGASGHLTPGGTGFAVATLVEYARSLT